MPSLTYIFPTDIWERPSKAIAHVTTINIE